MESLHIIKGLWNLSNIGAENSDTRIGARISNKRTNTGKNETAK